MGIDLLDVTYRLERRVQRSLRPDMLMIDQHTTVAEVVDLLERRLNGLTFEREVELSRLYGLLSERLKAPLTFRDLLERNRPTNPPLNEMVAPEQREKFWAGLCRDFEVSLPPLIRDAEGRSPHFPPEFARRRDILHHIRSKLFERLKWRPIDESAISGMLRDQMTKRFVKSWWPFGKTAVSPTAAVPRTWSHDELFDIVRETLIDCLDVEFDEVTPMAELVQDLGME